MKVNKFDGGLSQRVDPAWILPNEGVAYSNIDNTALTLKSALDFTLTSQQVGGYFYNFKGTWLSSASERSYVEYKDSVYFTENDMPAKKYDGAREILLGIVAPTVKLTATQANPVASEKISTSASVLQYVYTYYNSEDGIESAPSPISDELNLAANKVVDLTGFVASLDVQVDTIKIYRIGDNTTSMTLVKEVINSSLTVRDDILTLDLPGDLLDSYANQPPIIGGKHLIEAYGILFMAVADKLYYSRIGLPDYWPAAQYIDFSTTITGLMPVSSGILVQQENRIDILVGTTSEDFRKLPVSTEHGCVSHSANRNVKGIPIFASKSGLCTYGSGIVQVLSKDKLGKTTLSIVNAAVYDETLFICLTDGSLLAMDLRFNMAYKKYTFSAKIDNILVYNDILYARVGDYLATLFTGDELTLRYLSPAFTEDAYSITKSYNNIYIRSNGEFTVKVLIDGKEVLHKNIAGNMVHDITPPQEKQQGTSVQLDITGVGVVYEYEYKVLGRQNGR